MSTEAKVIAIDGSSASGKGTLAKSIAEKLNWRILDSGAIYRVIGLVAERYDLLNDEQALIKKLEDIDIQFLSHGCFVDDEDVSEQIRAEIVGQLASNVGTFSNLKCKYICDSHIEYIFPPYKSVLPHLPRNKQSPDIITPCPINVIWPGV